MTYQKLPLPKKQRDFFVIFYSLSLGIFKAEEICYHLLTAENKILQKEK